MANDDLSLFEQRKRDHIELALMPANQANELNPFDQLSLVHEALPDLNFDEIDVTSQRFKQSTKTPFFISSMTAGHRDADKINTHLMAACAQQGWAMGVGSQRRELTDPAAALVWSPLRKIYPDVFLFSNVGIAQLIETPIDHIKRLTDSLQAQAIIIHCNPLQECIQPEGTPQFKGCWDALAQLVRSLELPVVVKETGCGFSTNTLNRLNEIGVAAVDVSGLGGTHWGRIEGHRAVSDACRQLAADRFRHWGIDTVRSVQQAMALTPSYEVWGSGGVRHGLDAAKLIALGASSIGFAKPMLAAALESTEAVSAVMSSIEFELRVAMFCTGSRVLMDLRTKLCH